jgi:hypothetical protein
MNTKENKSEEEAIAALISVIDTRIIALQFELKETESNYNDKNVTSYQKGLYGEAIHAIKQRTEELQRNRPLITEAARNIWRKAQAEQLKEDNKVAYELVIKLTAKHDKAMIEATVALEQERQNTASAIFKDLEALPHKSQYFPNGAYDAMKKKHLEPKAKETRAPANVS